MRAAANLSLLYPELPFAERFAAARRDGFEGVEILFPYDLPPPALLDLLHANGLALALINTPFGGPGERGLAGLPGRQRDFRAAFGQALEVAGATGCRAIHVMAGTPAPETPRADALATLVENVRAAAALAAPVGITLTLEALNRHDAPGYLYHQPREVADVLARIDHPGVGMQFDIYHTLREGLDPAAELRAALPWVHHVQIAGAPERHEPDLDAPGVMTALRALAEAGYAGWLGCEYRPRGDTRSGLGWLSSLRLPAGAAA